MPARRSDMTTLTSGSVLLLAAVALLAASGACSGTERVFDRTVSADPPGTVEISNVSGKIDVIGWDRPEVSVHATLAAGVERVDVLTSGSRTTIKVILPNMSWHDGEADLEVRVPKASDVQATAV